MTKPHEMELNYNPHTGEIERDDGSAVADLGRFIGNAEERDVVGRLFVAAPSMARTLLDDVASIVKTVPEGQWSEETARKVAILRTAGVLP